MSGVYEFEEEDPPRFDQSGPQSTSSPLQVSSSREVGNSGERSGGRWGMLRRQVTAASAVGETPVKERWEEMREDARGTIASSQGRHFTFSDAIRAEKRRAILARALERHLLKLSKAEDTIFVDLCQALIAKLQQYPDVSVYPHLSNMCEIFCSRLLRPERKTVDGGAICEVLDFIISERKGSEEVFAFMYIPLLLDVVFAGMMSGISIVQTRFQRIMRNLCGISVEYITPHLTTIIHTLLSMLVHAPAISTETENLLKWLDTTVCSGRIYVYFVSALAHPGAEERTWAIKYIERNWEKILRIESEYLDEKASVEVMISPEDDGEEDTLVEVGESRTAWLPGEPLIFFESLENGLPGATMEYTAVALSILASRTPPISIPAGMHLKPLARLLLELIGREQQSEVNSALHYLLDFLAIHKDEFVLEVKLQTTVEHVLSLVPKYAVLCENKEIGAFVVPSTFVSFLDSLCQVEIEDETTKKLVTQCLVHVQLHFTATFYSPVLELIRLGDKRVVHEAIVRCSFLVANSSLQKVFPGDLVAAGLRQSSCLGLWSMLGLIFQQMERIEKKRLSEEELSDMYSLFAELETTLEAYIAEIESISDDIAPIVRALLCIIMQRIYDWADFSSTPKWVPSVMKWVHCTSRESSLSIEQWNSVCETFHYSLEDAMAAGETAGEEILVVKQEKTKIEMTHAERVKEDIMPEFIPIHSAALMLIASDAHNIPEKQLSSLCGSAWDMILEHDARVVRAAATVFVMCAEFSPTAAKSIMCSEFYSDDPRERMAAVQRFSNIWCDRVHLSKIYLRKTKKDEHAGEKRWPFRPFSVSKPYVSPFPLGGADFPNSSVLLGLPQESEHFGMDDERMLSNTEESQVVEAGSQELLPLAPLTPQTSALGKDTSSIIGGFRHSDRDDERSMEMSIERNPLKRFAVLGTIAKAAKRWRRKAVERKDVIMNPRTPLPYVFSIVTLSLIDLCDDLSPEVYSKVQEVLYNCTMDDPQTLVRAIVQGLLTQKPGFRMDVLSRLDILHRHLPKIHQHYGFLMFTFLIGYLGYCGEDTAQCRAIFSALLPLMSDTVCGLDEFSVQGLTNHRVTYALRGGGDAVTDKGIDEKLPMQQPSERPALMLLSSRRVDASHAASTHEKAEVSPLMEMTIQNAKALLCREILRYHPSQSLQLEKMTGITFLERIRSLDFPAGGVSSVSMQKAWLSFAKELLRCVPPDFPSLDIFAVAIGRCISDPAIEHSLLREYLATIVDMVNLFEGHFLEHATYEAIMPGLVSVANAHLDDVDIMSALHFVISCCFAVHGDHIFLAKTVPAICPSSFADLGVIIDPRCALTLLLALENPVLEDSFQVCRSCCSQYRTMMVTYTKAQFLDFLVAAFSSGPYYAAGSKFMEFLRIILEQIIPISPDSEYLPVLQILASLFLQQSGKKVQSAIDVMTLPLETQSEFIKLLTSLAKLDPIAHNMVKDSLAQIITPFLLTSLDENKEITEYTTYVTEGIASMQDDSYVDAALDTLLRHVNDVVAAKYTVTRIIEILRPLSTLPNRYAVAADRIRALLGDTLINVAHFTSTMKEIREECVSLLTIIMQNGAAPIAPPPGVDTMTAVQFKYLLREIVIPISLSLGKEGYSNHNAATPHWNWLMRSIVCGFRMDSSVMPEVFLALKAVLVRGDIFLSSYWPEVCEFVINLLKTPRREFSQFLLEFVEFVVVSRCDFSSSVEGFVTQLIPQFPIATELEREIIQRIELAIVDASPRPPAILLEEKVRDDASRMLL